MIWKLGLGVLVVLAVALGIAMYRTPSSAFSEQSAFTDEDRNRIFTIVFDPGVSAQTVREHAEGLPFAEGRVTAVYFYPDHSGVPRDGVTFANSIDQADRVIYESRGFGPWRFAFVRDPEVGVRFVDCEQIPEDSLCRKEQSPSR
jgi:hypothetical protein